MELSTLVLLTCGTLVGCGSQQESQSDKANNRTNNTSEYVQKHMNSGTLKNYTNGVTYDKIHNTVIINLHKQQSAQNPQFKSTLNKDLHQLQKQNPNIKSKIIRTSNSKVDND